MEPYRIFFPAGLVGGIWGVALWILFGAGLTTNYPGLVHPDIMIGGFLFAFATGFLMTAVPRFTGSFHAAGWEVGVSLILLGVVLVGGGAALWRPGARAVELGAALLNILFVIVFCARRFARRTHPPPPSFAFIGVGLLCGVVGTLLLVLGEWQLVGARAVLLGKTLYYEGMMLAIILGVGSRLIPALLGWTTHPLLAGGGERRARWLTSAMGGLFLVSFACDDLMGGGLLGPLLRALVASAVALTAWRLYRRPPAGGVLAYWLWTACVFLVVGLWVDVLSPSGYEIHSLHLVLVGGFSMMTLMIATRITLSHGGWGTSLERSSAALRWTGILIVVATATRVLATVTETYYLQHLVYASLTFCLAIAVWAAAFLRKILSRASPDPVG